MAPENSFLNPRLTGKRFDDHAIPLELLEDFSALEELVIEVAKYLFLSANPERQRVTRGFSKGVSLKLSGVEEGSAIVKILLVTSHFGLFPNANTYYFEKARDRIIEGIDAVSKNENVAAYIPENLLGYFNRIGKRLKDDETIDLSPDGNFDARLTKSIRKRLVLSSSKIEEVVSAAMVRGTIPEADKSKRTFTIQLDSGERILADLDQTHQQTVLDAFDKFEDRCYVLVSGVGVYDKFDHLKKFQSVEHISILDPLDIWVRTNEIATLKDGWFNGEGVGPDKEALQWFAETFDNNYDVELPLPLLFPTLEGGIQAEWSNSGVDVSLRIDLPNKQGYLHSLNLSSSDINESYISLADAEGWKVLNTTLNAILKA